jgi:hypothetical protein
MERAIIRLRRARAPSRLVREALSGEREQDGPGLQNAPVRIKLRRNELRGSRRLGRPCWRRRSGHPRGRLCGEPGLPRYNKQERDTYPGSQRPHETGPQPH